MEVPTRRAREPLKTALFKGEVPAGQEAISCSSMMHPVPRLVGDAMAVVAGVGEGEAEVAGIFG